MLKMLKTKNPDTDYPTNMGKNGLTKKKIHYYKNWIKI
jgi:hypothetical protein